MEKNLSAMIVAKPGRIRDCVHAMLISLSQFDSVDLADEPDKALQSILRSKTDIVLFGLPLPDGQLQAFFRELKSESPKTQSLVFVENIVQQQLARSAGADQVLLQGATAEQFIEALGQIVPSELIQWHLEVCARTDANEDVPDRTNLTRRS